MRRSAPTVATLLLGCCFALPARAQTPDTTPLAEGTDDHFCRKPGRADTSNLFRDKDFYYCADKPLPRRLFTYDVVARDPTPDPALIDQTLQTIAEGSGLSVRRDPRPEILFIVAGAQLSGVEIGTLLAQRQDVLPAPVARMYFSGSASFFETPSPHTCAMRAMHSPHISKTVIAFIDTRSMRPVDVVACAKHAVFALFDIATPAPMKIVGKLSDIDR